MLIGKNFGQEALRMKRVEVDGFEFLIIEKNGFSNVKDRANWQPGYTVHVRMDDHMKLK